MKVQMINDAAMIAIDHTKTKQLQESHQTEH